MAKGAICWYLDTNERQDAGPTNASLASAHYQVYSAVATRSENGYELPEEDVLLAWMVFGHGGVK
jgi:hypothetical protein